MQQIITINLEGVNSYLIKNENAFVLVDTGGHMFMDKTFDDRQEKLEEALIKQGVSADNLKLIVLTHGDNDHVCNAQYLSSKFGAPIAIHSADVEMVQAPKPDWYEVNAHYQSFVLKLVFKLMDHKIKLLMQKVYDTFETFSPAVKLKEGDDLTAYGVQAKVLHTPGHTPGSICLLDDEGNLIAGDLFANNNKPSLAINAQDFKELKESADKVLRCRVKMIYPGHGTPFSAEHM